MNLKTWDEVVSGPPDYTVNAFDDLVLCMHPQAEREWQAAVPNAGTAELHCLTIQTPEGAWHKEGKPDAAKWKQVFEDLCAKVQEARHRKAKRIHLVALAPYSLGALLGSLLDPQNHRLVVYQWHNLQGQKDSKSWRPYGPEWPSNPGERLASFFDVPPSLEVANPNDDSHIAVVINITGNGDREACRAAATRHADGKTVHVVHLKAHMTGQGSITHPADVDRAADEIDKLLQQLAENRPKTTLHLFYYGPLAVLVRGARSLGLRRVPIIVYEAMQYGGTWNLVPAVRFPERRLLIGEPPGAVQDIHPRSGTTARSASLADVVIITALKEEYDEARRVDEGAIDEWAIDTSVTGSEVAFRSYGAKDGGSLRIALTWATRMRTTATAIAAGPLIDKLGVRCVAMSGVCAGRRGKVQPGDVIIGSHLYTYDTGAVQAVVVDGVRQERFQAEPNSYPLDDQWLRRAQSFQRPVDTPWLAARPPTLAAQCDWLLERLLAGENPLNHADSHTRCPSWSGAIDRLRSLGFVTAKAPLSITESGKAYIEDVCLRNRGQLPNPPAWSVHVAPIATGNNVMRDSQLFGKLADSMRTVLGVEMEAAAIAAIAHDRKLPWLVMKGVMDHADHDKDDQLKPFAARASAECLIRFLRENLPSR